MSNANQPDFLTGVTAAAAAVRTLFAPTPLQHNAFLSDRFGAEIYLKREDLTPVRSYKLRGAFNYFRKALADPDSARQFVCASAGNHAQGFAYACQHFGVTGTVFMPVTTPQQKIAKTRVFGGSHVDIRLEGDIFDQCNAAAMAFAEENTARFVPPFDHADIIEGQATVGLELLEQIGKPIDLLIIPVGGGGLAAGIIQIMQALSPKTRVVLVEPAGAPSLLRSLEEGERVRLNQVDNFVDGAAVAQIGELNYAVLKNHDPASVLLIDEDGL